MNRFLLCIFSTSLIFGEVVSAAEVPKIPEASVDESAQPQDPKSASIQTRTDARTMTLSVPSPRGLIMDRNGDIFANNLLVYKLSVLFPEFGKVTDEEIVAWARERVDQIAEFAGQEWTISDKKLVSHYRHRRWLPLSHRSTFQESAVKKLKKSLKEGVEFQPMYVRNYPKQRSACHIIGYVRSTGKLPDGPIYYGDSMWEQAKGAEGLESLYEKDLAGQTGLKHILTDEEGNIIVDKYIQRPKIGNSLVLTLNAKWQKQAEVAIARKARRGALVMLDVQTGEVLTLASYPNYDLNSWIPRISQETYTKLLNDKNAPMYSRAFRATYPPASTFKAIVAASVLTDGVVGPYETVNCPPYIKIGSKKFHNHSKSPDGHINVAKALARSNNCWFYQVGIKAGAESFLATAQQCGFGSKTGLPLFYESSGNIPDNEYMIENYGRPMTDGDTANLSIGQGSILASPLQVAQGMAAIANGKFLPKLRLIKQIQRPNGDVIYASTPEVRNKLSLSKTAIDNVTKGMYQVIYANYGTGKKGAVGFTTMTGKTGTAQWVQGKELAWFAGFFPKNNPRIAYAVLYEGSKGESVSGGHKAAPIVRSFLNSISGDLRSYLATTPDNKKIETLQAEAAKKLAEENALKAIIVEESKTEEKAIIVD